MLKLNTKNFLIALREMPVSDPAQNELVGQKYLLEKFALPLLNGRTVRLNELDFDAFDVDDIDELEERACSMAYNIAPVFSIYDAVLAAQPVVVTTVRFV